MSLRKMIGSVNTPNERLQTNKNSMNRTFNKVIEIGDRKISVVSQIEKFDLQMAQTNSTLYFTLTKNLKRLNTETEKPQPQYKLFSYSPGSEYFSQSPQSRKVIEKNKEFLRHASPRSANYKRRDLEIKVITTGKTWERGQVKSARSQRYVEFNKDLLEADNFFPRVMSPEKVQSPKSQKVHRKELSAISGAGGRVGVENLIQKLVKHFRIYQVRKEELMNDQNYSRGSLGDRTDYHSQQMDLRNFMQKKKYTIKRYSLWDPAFIDYLQNLLLDGTQVKVESIKNFFKGRNVNEIKYSAFRVQTEKFLKVEMGDNEIVQYTVKRIDDYRDQFIGEGWFEVFGGEKSLKKLLQEVASQQVQDIMLQHFFAYGLKNTINAQEHYVSHLFQPLVKSIQTPNIIQPKYEIPQQHSQLTITYLEFFRFKLHFQLALRKQKQSNLCMNMFAQILEKYRYTLIKPEPPVYKISQDSEFHQLFISTLKERFHKVYGVSQLYMLITNREKFYQFVSTLAKNLTMYFIRDLPSRVHDMAYKSFEHMKNDLQLLNKSKNFWSFKEVFVKTFNEFCQDQYFLTRIKQSFDQIQIIMRISPSLYIDLFDFSQDSQQYIILEKNQKFVEEIIQQMQQDQELNSQLKQIQEGPHSIGISNDIYIEWLLQFLYQTNPQEHLVSVFDVKAFLHITGLDSKFLQRLVGEVQEILKKKLATKTVYKLNEFFIFATQHIPQI